MSYIENRYLVLNKPWDGKLRIVIFDIPEHKKGWRDWIRQELILLQFQQLQKSVHIGKYPLPESFYKEHAQLTKQYEDFQTEACRIIERWKSEE